MAAKESKETLRIRQLENEVFRCQASDQTDTLLEYLPKISPHGNEINKLIETLHKELIEVTSNHLKIDRYSDDEWDLFELLDKREYELSILLRDIEYGNEESVTIDEYVKEMLEYQGGDFFKYIMTQTMTPTDYAQAKETLSALPNVSHSKKSKSRSKKVFVYEKTKDRLVRAIRLYNLRERIRAPEVQTAIKKIIDEATIKVAYSIMSPKPPSAEQRLEECEAKAERYRKALRLSVGIPNDPVKVGGRRRTVKRRRGTFTKA